MMVVTDRKSCERWVAQAPLGDPVSACAAIGELIDALADRPPRTPRAHVEVLECLRRPISLTLEALAFRLAGRALPLSESESRAFVAGFDMCSAYGRAWRLLLQMAHSEAEPSLAGDFPLMLTRAAECAYEVMVMHYRVRREIDGEHWHDLHELYRLAESLGAALARADPAAETAPTCTDFYVRALLLSLASPYGMTLRAFDWTHRWLRRWSAKVVLSTAPGPRDCVAVNLESHFAPRARALVGQPGEMVRFLDLSALRRSVKRRIRSLEEGATPQSLGLGTEGSQEELLDTLRMLYQQWFENPIARQYSRRLVSSRVELLVGVHETHGMICEPLPIPQRPEWEYSRVEWERLYVYGNRSASRPVRTAVVPERWDMLEESAMGFRLRRRNPERRFAHRQLIAVRPQGESRFILSEIRWLVVGIDATVTMGVRNLPGLPVGVWVRRVDDGEGAEFRQGFALPATGGEPNSLVLGGGMFRLEQVLELRAGENTRRVMLRNVLHHGFDFERMGFVVLG